jgi:ribose 5-phosphate isomerase A
MILGLGSGTTFALVLEQLAERVANGSLHRVAGVPSSERTAAAARALGFPLTTLDEHPVVDLAIDGADEVAPDRGQVTGLIKGGGGALLRERIVLRAARRVLIVADESKLSPRLGTRHALPVEVFPFGWRPEAEFLAGLGARVTRRLGEGGAPYVTDQGNWILDCDFGPIVRPEDLVKQLDARAGIAAHGLFLGFTGTAVLGDDGSVRTIGMGA